MLTTSFMNQVTIYKIAPVFYEGDFMKTKNGTHTLRDMPGKTRQMVQRRLAFTLAVFALLLALSGIPSVHAANITVDGITCTLPDAIGAANTNAIVGGCVAGDDAGGYDTIDLQTNVTLGAALPVISSNIVLQGNNHTIDADGIARVLAVGGTGTLTLEYATITGGFVFGEGGGILNNGGTVTINNSTISGNSASSYGGGIRNTAGGNLTLNNSTVSGNMSNADGGGINSDGNTLVINYSTITNNSAIGWGGGIGAGGGTTTLNHSIVSGNIAELGSNEILNFFTTVTGDNFNLFGDNSETNSEAFGGFLGFTPGASDITATSDGGTPTALAGILDVNLAQNGVDPHTFTHALIGGSPAIDVIPDDGINCDGEANTGTSRDQRGGVRANTTFGSGAACDIGAYEFGSTTPTAVTIEGLGAQVGGSAGLAASGAAGILALLSGGVLTRRLRRKSAGGD